MEWEAPPPRAPDEPCCVLGEPRLVTSRSDGVALAHEAPVVVWGPSVWGLFATRLVELPGETITMPTFFQLGAEGAPLGPPQDVGGIGLRRANAAWAEGRWALMYAAGSLEHGHVFTVSVQLFDRALRPAAGSSKFGLTGVCVAHTGSDGLSRVELLTLDTEGRLYGAAVEIVETRFRGSLANCTVGSDGRGFLVAWWNGSELWVRRVDIPER